MSSRVEPDVDVIAVVDRVGEAPAVTALAQDPPDEPVALATTSDRGQATVEIPRVPAAPDASEDVTRIAAAAHAAGTSARTVNRLAALLAGLGSETVMRLDSIDDKLTTEVVERLGQVAEIGWDDDKLATVVERALRSDGKTPAPRRKAFRDCLGREARKAGRQAA